MEKQVKKSKENLIEKSLKLSIIERAENLFEELETLEEGAKISVINSIRLRLHKHSPFSQEPVDCVLWVKATRIQANDYNPNSVAPPEMKLLEHSITEDGYTQPIVSWKNDEGYEVVDGFHRNRVGTECPLVRERVKGYLPLTVINQTRIDRSDRIASTIRHNRARGKHQVTAMADIVVELKKRNWSDKRIGIELGMDPDEVLRLTQITGLAEMFANREFSEAWEHNGDNTDKPIVSEEEGEIDLEWVTPIVKDREPGWHDRTEQSSVLYDKKSRHLGVIQKSRFIDNEWFWYAYTKPMKQGRAESRGKAKKAIEEARK